MTNAVGPTVAAKSTDAREERGRQLASSVKIKRVGRRWAVPSQTQPSERYLVNIEDADAACTCPDFEQRRTVCKHQHAVLFWIAWGRNVGADGSVTETVTVKMKRKTYPQKDWSAYNASQHHEKEYFERLARALCAEIPQPPRKPGPGRNARLLRDLAFATLMKIYLMLSGRRMRTDLNACAAKGYLTHVGHENCVFNFLGDAATTPLFTSLVERSSASLRMIEAGQYAIDSTGFSTAVYDRWFSQKHGQLCSQNTWVKLHVMVGTVTHAVTSAVVTSRSDDSQLPELLRRTLVHHDVRELSADKAYSTHDNHEVLERFGIEPYIAFQDHAVVNAKYPIWSRHLCEFLFNLDKFKQHYHRRSNVESTFDMIKARFGATVAMRRPTAQANEVLAKCVAHNLCCMVKAIFTAGLVPTFWPDALAALPSPQAISDDEGGAP